MTTRLLPLLAVGLLVACTGQSGPCPIQDPNPLPSRAEVCRAGELQRYLNAASTPDVMAAIIAVAGSQNTRTIRPGDAVTMDFRAKRLNVELDAEGRITRLRCG